MPRGKTAKSERTRAAIEAAARRLFAQQGYERTTVREIAAAAEIDPALVIRYFGSKDQLFSLVAEPDLRLPDLLQVPVNSIGETLVGHFLDLWEGGSGMTVLLRSAASNESAAERLKQIFASQVFPVIAAVGRRETTPQRAGLVATQLLGLAMTRYILKLSPVVAMERKFVIREIGKTVQRYITLG
jgi:AcrR family transcriptional regulator